ncbi:single-stranded DNA-binding protein [Helicobacter trogontum]|uniref:Single-stranded DNA-binding protein n=2 Tax=Helicobacter trogontum TaxID=50960 RepID=A0A4U8TG13_9HELI|nr:single-stranded DNA-binding protein [Helicobacter trogontum]MCI5785867.1 single-stranded DNA-binding protein [Helicobacter trogontum]MDY5184858.1 single-stranded DNA-binding protein [Helicobacter trogontum]TLD99071.1 single-stranded DNA-binding protein [Helicobacter trogontum]
MFNRVIMVGNLTRDVELRYLNTGAALATFGLASNRRYKKSDGMQVDDTCFIDVTLFGRTAEVANQYLRKGSKVLIEGRLNFETWTDQQGGKRSKHTIIAESMQMLDTRQQGEYGQNTHEQAANYNGGYDSSYTQQQGYQPQSYQRNVGNPYSHNMQQDNAMTMQGSSIEPPVIDIDEEEIPF